MSTASETLPPYICDVQDVLREYVSQTGADEPTYETFVKIWDKFNLSYIHYSNPPVQSPEDFLQYLYQAALLFIENPGAALVPSTSEDLARVMKKKEWDKREGGIVQSGCMFLLYGLYATQPSRNSPQVAVRLTLETEELVRSVSLKGGDTENAYTALIGQGGFQIVAGPRHGPALAPDTLEKVKRKREREWGPLGFSYTTKKRNKNGNVGHSGESVFGV